MIVRLDEGCINDINCPAVFVLAKGGIVAHGDFAFIGKKASQELLDSLPPGTGIGPDEALVIVPRSVMISSGLIEESDKLVEIVLDESGKPLRVKKWTKN